MATAGIQCPYCWETVDIFVDESAGDQEYVEDCQVCCHPILLRISIEDGRLVDVAVGMENE